MEDLFDVFDEVPPPGPGENSSSKAGGKKRRANGDVKDVDGEVTASPDKRQRRDEPLDNSSMHKVDADSRSDSSDSEGEDEDEDEDEDDRSDAMQQLSKEPEPRVADTFETQQSREVTASAGLQAEKEDANVVLQHQVRHQVALPAEYNYVPLSEHKAPADPARTWTFPLDPFQQVSISSIQRNESVLVSAHTSAGKTVVAEYAIAQCLKNNQRVIYTSPIKALSNQKYREFLALFGDVGLMTGDVTINPEATCLVMTTEILRSMLYRGSEVMREVAWVVFDEVHYLRDKARGVVWEETIILLPDKVRYVFLSATIPNAMQFAEWITKIHSQPCHVVYTDFRPTPLQHYLFPGGSDGIHLVVDEKGVFREDNFTRAMNSIADKQGDNPSDPNVRRKGKGKDKKMNKGGQKGGASDIYKIVKMIMQKNYNPVIVFSFSKRECEALALQMSALSFNEDAEKDMVDKVFNGAIDTLSDEDKQLPQIQNMLPLLMRGVGIHHSGLLPILKETIEILFQEGLLKVLFATETFSIGLNMPAKTVVFTNVRKFDGITTRWLTGSEFIQMSGRAGRRGIDDRGIVIMMIDERMEPATAKGIVRGEQDKLNSAFHLSYNMILNLIRVEGISPEFMLERCFYQFQSIASVSGLEKQLHQVEAERSSIIISDEATIKDYYDLRQNIEAYAKDMKEVITHPNYALQYMQPGRLIRIRFQEHDFGWGVVVQHKKRIIPKNKQEGLKPQQLYSLDVCMNVASGSRKRTLDPDLPDGVQPAAHGDKTEMKVVDVLLSCVDQIGGVRLYMPDNLNSPKNMDSVRLNLEEVKRRFPDGVALLDPVSNMGIRDESFKRLIKKIEVLETRLRSNSLHESPRLPELYNQYAKKVELQNQVKALKKRITEALSITQLEELKCRKRVLRRLGFINENDVVELKARVACEISTGDELVLSELLFNRFFNMLTPEQCAAALSCFVFEEKADVKSMRDDLQKPFLEIQKQARIVAKVSQESKLPVKEDDYLATFNPGLMEVMYEWTKGKTFAEICKITSVYEGSLIRVFRRLEELLRQMGQAAKVMGNDELCEKFEEALTKLRRDIVAAQSLYL